MGGRKKEGLAQEVLWAKQINIEEQNYSFAMEIHVFLKPKCYDFSSNLTLI